MVLVGGDLYVANTDAILRFPYRVAVTRPGPCSSRTMSETRSGG
jgi:hypothetical protein